MQLLSNTQLAEPFFYRRLTDSTGQAVLNLYILQCREFREETQFLEQTADMTITMKAASMTARGSPLDREFI